MAHPELGSKILDAVIEQVGDHGRVESQARLEGRNMTMVLAPERRPTTKKTPNSTPASNEAEAATPPTSSAPGAESTATEESGEPTA